jgi:hypothetical protein
MRGPPNDPVAAHILEAAGAGSIDEEDGTLESFRPYPVIDLEGRMDLPDGKGQLRL